MYQPKRKMTIVEIKKNIVFQIIDDVILEIECKMITCKPGAIDDALLGIDL